MFQFQNSIFFEKYAIIHMASLMWWCRNMDHRTFFYTSNTILWIKFYCFSFSKSLLKFIQIFFKSSQLGIFHISSEVLFLHVSYSKIFKKTKNIFILKYITYFHQHCFSNVNRNQYNTNSYKNETTKLWNEKRLVGNNRCKNFRVTWCLFRNDWVRWNLLLGVSFELSPEKVKLNGKTFYS